MQREFKGIFTHIAVLSMILCQSINGFGQAADDCANATVLSINAAPTSGTIDCNFTTQTNEPLGCAPSQGGTSRLTAWYRFNTGSEDYLWLRFNETNNTNGQIVPTRINVYGPYSSGQGCLPVSSENVACQAVYPNFISNNYTDGFNLTGLSTNSDYLIQVIYYDKSTGGDCESMDFDISIETPLMDESTCNFPVDTGCTYATTPTVNHVVNTCEGDTMEVSHPDTNHSTQYCYEFTAASIQVDFNVIITSNCGTGGPPGQSGGGNVAFFDWKAYESGACGSAIDSGDLGDLTIDPLTIGTAYTVCYEFATPQTTYGCEHSKHRPFFVGANNNNSTLLPIEFIDLRVRSTIAGDELMWYSNDVSDVVEFQIHTSANGENFTHIKSIKSGFQNQMKYPVSQAMLGKYVRVVGVNDFGKNVKSNLVKINPQKFRSTEVNVLPDAVKVSWFSFENEQVHIQLRDLNGNMVSSNLTRADKGNNSKLIDRSALSRGIYFVTVISGNYKESFKVFL